MSLFVLSKRFDWPLLLPTVAIAKLPAPPSPPDNCFQVRRELQLLSASERTVKIEAPLDSDQIEVYRSVIREWMSDKKEPLNVSDITFPMRVGPLLDEEQGCGCLTGMRPEDLLKASHSFRVLTGNIFVEGAITLVDQNQQSRKVSANDPNATMRKGMSAEHAVNNAFANGLFSLSEIVFDRDGQHAAVSYSFVCGSLCGSGGTWLFEKTSRGWTKMHRQCGGGWVS